MNFNWRNSLSLSMGVAYIASINQYKPLWNPKLLKEQFNKSITVWPNWYFLQIQEVFAKTDPTGPLVEISFFELNDVEKNTVKKLNIVSTKTIQHCTEFYSFFFCVLESQSKHILFIWDYWWCWKKLRKKCMSWFFSDNFSNRNNSFKQTFSSKKISNLWVQFYKAPQSKYINRSILIDLKFNAQLFQLVFWVRTKHWKYIASKVFFLTKQFETFTGQSELSPWDSSNLT